MAEQSRITDKILPVAREWQQRPLEAIYAVVFMDAIHYHVPTICGIRRRGYTPESMRMFAEKVGVAKREQLIDLQLMEWCVRQDLNERANRYT